MDGRGGAARGFGLSGECSVYRMPDPTKPKEMLTTRHRQAQRDFKAYCKKNPRDYDGHKTV
jgi:hypothetical protein